MRALRALPQVSPQDVYGIVRHMDKDGDGLVSFDEFRAAVGMEENAEECVVERSSLPLPPSVVAVWLPPDVHAPAPGLMAVWLASDVRARRLLAARSLRLRFAFASPPLRRRFAAASPPLHRRLLLAGGWTSSMTQSAMATSLD